MLSYIVSRTLHMIPKLLFLTLLVFVIIQLPPGDYLSTYIAELQSQGEDISADRIEFLRQQYGLDKSMPEQYVAWVTSLLQGDLGYSFVYSVPVLDLLGDTLILTVVLNFGAMIFVYVVAFPIGVYSATRQYSIGDYGLTFLGLIGLATPNFLLALILMWLGQVYFGVSIGGLYDPEFADQPWTWEKYVSLFQHLIVPVVVIGTAGTASMIRRLRANLLDELQKQYVTTGKAKGLPGGKLLVKYPLRMSLNPFISDIGNELPGLISGSVIISWVMSLPTVGPVLIEALYGQDMYLAGAIVMFLAVLTLIGMLISDLLLSLVDPRIRLGGGVSR